MEFKDVMLSLAVMAIGIFAFLGLSNDFNTQWGSTIASDFSSDYEKIQTGLVGNITQESTAAGDAGTPEEGQSSGEGDESLIKRSLAVLNLIPQLVQMPVKMIGVGGSSIGLPPMIVLIGQSLFVFSFFVTLAYVFITGTRRILGR